MISKEEKYKAVVHYKYYCRSLRKVAKMHKVSKSSLQRWVRQDPTIRKIRTKKERSAEIVRSIRETIQQNPFSTWSALAQKLQLDCGITISRSTAGRILHSLQFTRKKAFRVVDKTHDPVEIMQFCNEYIQNEDSLVCIDEACFYVGDKGRYGYSSRGSRLNVKASRTLRMKKYTLMMAISRCGVIHFEIMDHNCKIADFLRFVNALQVPPQTTLLMDNVAFHKNSTVRQAIKDKMCKPLYIPPYSPKTNAIENVFGMLKRAYRAECPYQIDDSFQYKQLFENILLRDYNFNPFFDRVKTFIDSTIANHGKNFAGYD